MRVEVTFLYWNCWRYNLKNPYKSIISSSTTLLHIQGCHFGFFKKPLPVNKFACQYFYFYVVIMYFTKFISGYHEDIKDWKLIEVLVIFYGILFHNVGTFFG